jgi:signal peptidase I
MSKKENKSGFIVLIKDIVFFAVAFIITISFVFASSQVNQSSMEDTLFSKERLIELKLTYLFSKPERGDIVIFAVKPYKKNILNTMYESVKYIIESRTNQYDNKRLIKRVIAVPGEVIDIRNGDVFIDRKKLEEPYVKGITNVSAGGMKFPYEVKDDEYIVLGDNRAVSKDSRDSSVGPVSFKTQIEGKIVLRFWPFNKFGKVE